MNIMTSPAGAATVLALALLAPTALQAQDPQPTGIQDAIPQSIDSLSGGGWSGNTKYDGWYNLSISSKTKNVHGTELTIPGNTGYPTTFTSTAAWTNPILSQVKSYGDTSTAGLNKTSNNGTNTFGPYPAGESLYAISFSNTYNAKGGTYTVTESNPVLNLASIVFQVEIGNANGYDFFESDVTSNASTPLGTAASRQVGGLDPLLGRAPGGPVIFPTLNLTLGDGTTLAIAANFAELITQGENGTMPMPTGPGGANQEEPILINLYGFQWDLSQITEDITGFSISMNVVEHTQTYAMQLDQSDEFTQVIASPSAVPEPSALLIGALGALAGFRRRRC